MQHLDEGMIHSWLDGALSPEETARVEAHVAQCAQCAAMAAEARGFIAASSRILTALDDAPRGVIPVQPILRRRFGPAWRAAAAVLVVALGTVAIRNTLRGNRSGADASLALDSAVITSAQQAPQQIPAAESGGNAASTAAADKVVRPMVLSKPASPSRGASTKPSSPAPGASIADAQKASAPTARPFTKSAEAPPTAGAVAMRDASEDYASIEQPLKIVRVDSTPVEKRTVYEIAPNETVTLVEARVADRIELGNVVVTGAATRAAASVPSASDSRRVMSPNTVRSNAAAPQTQATTGFAAGERTIEWKDPSTGHVLRLTGRYSPERLEEIKKRIERQRAAQKKP